MDRVFEDIRLTPYRLKCYMCKITKISTCHLSYARDEFVCSKKCNNEYKDPTNDLYFYNYEADAICRYKRE